MMPITPDYLHHAENWMLITTLAYFLMNGAQLFETAVLIPKWTSNPPLSLSVLQGPYAPNLKTFWIIAHTIHELTFIAAIALTWHLPRIRIAMLIIFVVHFAVRIWTIGYFAPKIIAFQKATAETVSDGMKIAVTQWRNLNYLRVSLFIVLSVATTLVYCQLRTTTSSSVITNKNQLMDQRLSVITLGVDDLPRQKEFYKSTIGWAPVAENKDIIFFKLNGFLFSLLDRKTLAEGSGVEATGSGFRSITISYNVPSKAQVDQMHQAFKDKGVTILKAPSPTPFGGYYFTFADPEHNVLEIAYNPYIPLDEAGNTITHNNIDNL